MNALLENRDWADHDWTEFLSPKELESEPRFALNPLILEEHATRHERPLVKEVNSNHIRYSILSDEQTREDPTQSSWRFEYGAEFYFDGSAKAFINVSDEIERPEDYAEAIAERIFPSLEDRSLEYLGLD